MTTRCYRYALVPEPVQRVAQTKRLRSQDAGTGTRSWRLEHYAEREIRLQAAGGVQAKLQEILLGKRLTGVAAESSRASTAGNWHLIPVTNGAMLPVTAMTDRTNAERQRRYIARLKSQATKTGVTNVSGHAVLVKELAQAKARIAELEKTIASLTQRDPIQTQPQQRWPRKSADEKIIMRLQARVYELEALVLPLDDEGKTAVGQYKRKVNREFKTRWKHCEAAIMKRSVIMHSKDYNLFLAGFHPDASPEMRDKARNRFEKLYKKFVFTDNDKWPTL